MTPLVPNASLGLKDAIAHSVAAIFSVFTSRPLSMAVGPLRRIDLVVAGYWLSFARGVLYSDIRLRIFSRD